MIATSNFFDGVVVEYISNPALQAYLVKKVSLKFFSHFFEFIWNENNGTDIRTLKVC
eukprot:UN23905